MVAIALIAFIMNPVTEILLDVDTVITIIPITILLKEMDALITRNTKHTHFLYLQLQP